MVGFVSLQLSGRTGSPAILPDVHFPGGWVRFSMETKLPPPGQKRFSFDSIPQCPSAAAARFPGSCLALYLSLGWPGGCRRVIRGPALPSQATDAGSGPSTCDGFSLLGQDGCSGLWTRGVGDDCSGAPSPSGKPDTNSGSAPAV